MSKTTLNIIMVALTQIAEQSYKNNMLYIMMIILMAVSLKYPADFTGSS